MRQARCARAREKSESTPVIVRGGMVAKAHRRVGALPEEGAWSVLVKSEDMAKGSEDGASDFFASRFF